jgi:putative selenate reductase molybdopterin-binding subunit
MSESPYNPVAAALANAIRDATGVRLFETPFMADELYRAVIERNVPALSSEGACAFQPG